MFALVGSAFRENQGAALLDCERRAFARFPSDAKVYCSAQVDERVAGELVQVKNLSALGISIVTNHAFDLGTRLKIQLQRRNGVYVRTTTVRVVHVEEESSHIWCLGCAFVRELSDED